LKLTEKQRLLIMLISIFLLHGFDSLFLTNTTFSVYKLVANIFLIALLIKLMHGTISDWKVCGKRGIIGSILVFILVILMFKVVNF
jgi:hypothetical protein